MKGWRIREASAYVAAIVYQGTRRRLNKPPPPPSTLQYNGKQGSGKILETCTHTRRSLDLGRIDPVLFSRYKEEEKSGVGGGWWLSVVGRGGGG